MMQRALPAARICQRCSARITNTTYLHKQLSVANITGGHQFAYSDVTQLTRSFTGTAKVFKQPHLPEEFQGQQAKRDSELQSLIDELELKDILDPEETEGHQGQSVPGFRASPGSILSPTLETHEYLFGDTPYKRLPIAHVKANRNNTMVTITDHTGSQIAFCTAGMIGFRNANTKTTVAAMAVALNAGKTAVKEDVSYIRVTLNGVGPGRMAAVQGLEKSGLAIVSLTDVSVINMGSRMGRKLKRGKRSY